MLGFIKKDLSIIKNNVKSLIIAIAIYAIFIITNSIDISFILPFMAFVLFTSTFSYDDYNKWNAYALTLPKGRENIVKAKYISAILLTFIATLFGIFFSALAFSLKDVFQLDQILFNSIIYLTTILVMISIICPLLFKFGLEKGRIILMVMIFGIFSIASILTECVNIAIPSHIISLFHHYGLIFFLSVSAVSLIISYHISKRICLKREF